MNGLEQVRQRLAAGDFEFTRHALRRAVERDISAAEIQEAGAVAEVIEDYPDDKSEVAMFECHVCGNTTARAEFVSEVFLVAGRRVLVEHIPAQVCQRCGEATFSRESAERVRQLLHGEARPIRTVPLEVFALS